MNVIDNENGSVTVDMAHNDFIAVIAAYAEQTEDLKTIKNIVYTLLAKIGFIDNEGVIREVINMKMLMDIAMKATMGNKKFKEDMAFLADALPLIEKYKNL